MALRSKSQAPDLTDAEVRTILVKCMAEANYDPAIIYAFQTTGVYFYPNCRCRLSKEKRRAWNRAVREYFVALDRAVQ
jgi:methylphosphotriester-DNA--protein-cysteine methyltransferase